MDEVKEGVILKEQQYGVLTILLGISFVIIGSWCIVITCNLMIGKPLDEACPYCGKYIVVLCNVYF